MVTAVLCAVSVALTLGIGLLIVFLAHPQRLNARKRYAVHMKPGQGATIEGLLVASSRGEFRLLDAVILESADQSHSLANPVRVLRENVYCLEELE